MPEIFDNNYTFSPDAVPSAGILRDTLAARFQTTFEIEQHEAGFHGAPRAFASLKDSQMQIWMYWEANRPEIQITVDEPMERMIPINAVISSLNGKPRYPDGYWRLRRRYRTQRTIRRIAVTLIVLLLAVAAIWELHWWGVLLVFVLLAGGVFTYIYALARSFRR
jgi:hypothetical protein